MRKQTFSELVDRELNEGLVFSFAIEGNISQPGERKIRLFDVFRFRVSVRNQSSIPVKELNGVIARTDMCDFEPMPFSVQRLEPQQSVQLATVDARLIHETPAAKALEQVGLVSCTAIADLAWFEYQEWDKPLRHEAAPKATPDLGDATAANATAKASFRESKSPMDDLWGKTLPLARERGS